MIFPRSLNFQFYHDENDDYGYLVTRLSISESPCIPKSHWDHKNDYMPGELLSETKRTGVLGRLDPGGRELENTVVVYFIKKLSGW